MVGDLPPVWWREHVTFDCQRLFQARSVSLEVAQVDLIERFSALFVPLRCNWLFLTPQRTEERREQEQSKQTVQLQNSRFESHLGIDAFISHPPCPRP